jgi:tetratricopeptide (TPR) repeat protein
LTQQKFFDTHVQKDGCRKIIAHDKSKFSNRLTDHPVVGVDWSSIVGHSDEMKRILLLLALLCSTSTTAAPAIAAADDYQKAKALYKAGRYSQALPLFEKTVLSNPYDAEKHYFLGLCYRELKQIKLAKQHFEWATLNTQDIILRSYAGKALNALIPKVPLTFTGGSSLSNSGASTGSSNASRTSTVNGVTTFSGASPAAGGSSPASASASATAPAQAPTQTAAAPDAEKIRKLGRCKVLVFEIASCQYCHEFAPTFDEAANKYRNSMDFEHVNADDNADLKEKYGIKSYPRLVYLDGRGNVLYNEGRGAFSNRLTELTGR